MKITIGRYNAATRAVPVTFEEGDIVHRRQVNACFDDGGVHDRKATIARVEDVARGVACKIALGVIVNQPEEAGDVDD